MTVAHTHALEDVLGSQNLPPPPSYLISGAPVAAAPASAPQAQGLPAAFSAPLPMQAYLQQQQPLQPPGGYGYQQQPNQVPGGYGAPKGYGGLPMAPTYHPTVPYPSEQELANRPLPTSNLDPFDETYPTYNLFIGDMTPDFTEADLYEAFQQAGPIHSVNVVKDKQTGLAKGSVERSRATAAA
jgi:hypothetical protein